MPPSPATAPPTAHNGERAGRSQSRSDYAQCPFHSTGSPTSLRSRNPLFAPLELWRPHNGSQSATGERANRALLLTATTAQNVAGFSTAGYFVTVFERLLTEPEQLGRRGQGGRSGFVIKVIPASRNSPKNATGSLFARKPRMRRYFWGSGLGGKEHAPAFRGGFLGHEGV